MQFPLSVDPAAYRRILRIRDVVGRYEKRTKRQETIQHLSGYPLACRELRSPRGKIVGATVSSDVPKCLAFRHISRFTANNDRKFRFVVIFIVDRW